jgi:uncharacterized protein with ATP-grasp and redox domains
MLADNQFPAAVLANIEELLAGIPESRIRPLTDRSAPDAAGWDAYLAPYLGANWLPVPWFFAETYFYRRIMEATGYFELEVAPDHGADFDPFAKQKRHGLETNLEAIRILCRRVDGWLEGSEPDSRLFADLLRIDLWGNQADLSIWPAGARSQPTHRDDDQRTTHTLVDDTGVVADHLLNRDDPAARVDILLDNAGLELVADLCLAVFILHRKMSQVVLLNAKAHPTFVSDAIAADVLNTMAFLAAGEDAATASLGDLIRRYLDAGRLRLQHHFFWTSPLPMWEMPADLRQDLGQSTLIICKGDANYRRLLGDRHWPFTTPFAEIVTYCPAPLSALRTLKSEIVCGLNPGQPESTAAMDPDWMTGGRWGLIQFATPVISIAGH